MAMTAGRQITTLRARQRELVQTWGPDVEILYEPEHVKAQNAMTGNKSTSMGNQSQVAAPAGLE